MSRRSGQLSRAGRVEERGGRTMKDRAADDNEYGRQTTTKVGGSGQQKWAVDYDKNGQRTSTIVGVGHQR
jgi:hypothetical protein